MRTSIKNVGTFSDFSVFCNLMHFFIVYLMYSVLCRKNSLNNGLTC
jgi:hypothetical protein